MEITRLADLKPRTVWEITDDAFDMYRERFVLLASVSAVMFVPLSILFSVFGSVAFRNLLRSSEGQDVAAGAVGMLAWLLPVFGLGYVLHFGATSLAVRDILTGAPVTVASVYKRTFRRFFPLFFASLIISLMGFLLVCLGAIGPALVAAYYWFTPHGILLEDRKMSDAIKRSRDMAHAYFGKSFGMLCLIGLLSGALSLGLQGVIGLAFVLFPQSGGTAASVQEMQNLQLGINAVAGAIIGLLIAPLPGIATTLLYYDLRVRREGLDMESEAQQWGITLAPDPYAGVLNPKIPKEKGARR